MKVQKSFYAIIRIGVQYDDEIISDEEAIDEFSYNCDYEFQDTEHVLVNHTDWMELTTNDPR